MRRLALVNHAPDAAAITVPAGIKEADVRARLLNDYNLEIGAGLGALAGKVWRIGLMGESSSKTNVLICLGALDAVLTDMGALAGPPAAVAVQSDPQSLAGSELVELGNGVSALRFRAGTQSVLITDLGLLALVQPAERSRFDEFMRELSGYRPLYFVLSAAEQGETSLEFTVRQGSMSRKLTEGDGVVLLSGDPATVAPGKPVSGVLLLPGTTNLRAPLQLQWQHLSAGMIFRR